ncbi:hypothetical protein CBP35_06865 [Acidovorax carolinensis]|nr:hypothetical protein CBP35_06865 [Acidovorax carolinensis]
MGAVASARRHGLNAAGCQQMAARWPGRGWFCSSLLLPNQDVGVAAREGGDRVMRLAPGVGGRRVVPGGTGFIPE